MIVWIDAQLSPALAAWISETFGVEKALAVKDLGLRNAKDRDIFDAARSAKAVVLTKDADFVALVERLGSPPQVLWITSGNTSNQRLKEILLSEFPRARQLLEQGVPLVEITDRPR